VEVDHAAALEFRDLHKRHPASPREPRRGQSSLTGQDATDGDSEPAPEFGGVPIERNMGWVVVAVRADRLPEPGIILGMDRGAPARPPVPAQPRRAAWVGSVRVRRIDRRGWCAPARTPTRLG
jgi:hypothetical protein